MDDLKFYFKSFPPAHQHEWENVWVEVTSDDLSDSIKNLPRFLYFIWDSIPGPLQEKMQTR